MNAFAVGDCVPDITFVLDVDAVTATTRMQKPRRLDRIEKQPAEFHERVRQGYRELPAREPDRILLIGFTTIRWLSVGIGVCAALVFVAWLFFGLLGSRFSL